MFVVIGISSGNAKLKTPQTTRAMSVFLHSERIRCYLQLQRPEWIYGIHHGKGPSTANDWPQSNGSKRLPLHSHLWLPQPKPAAVHSIMFEGPAKELDKDWDTL